MTERTRQILSRFPAHLDATRPGKQLTSAVDGLSSSLELLSADLALVRRSHRIAHADTLRDVRQLGALHGLSVSDFAVMFTRADRVRQLATQLERAIGHSAPDRDSAADALLDLWGVEKGPGRLAMFAPTAAPGAGPDLEGGARSLVSIARAWAAYPQLVNAARTRVVRIAAIHANGNGTIRALLEGAANALDLDIDARTNAEVKARLIADGDVSDLDTTIEDEFFHSTDLFLHTTYVRDRAPLMRTVPAVPIPPATSVPAGATTQERLPTTLDVLGIEENPLRRERFPASQPEACEHGHVFRVVRRGFGRELLQVQVTGRENRTIGPMLVNRDEGRGIGYAGAVPMGKSLVFTEEGRAMLDGADVTSRAYAWHGACFASVAEPDRHDFVFAGPGADPSRQALFVQATPATALDRDTTYPGSGDPVTPPGIGIGVTRFAFFLQEAHLSSRDGAVEPFTVRRVTPYPSIGFADQSVFADGSSPPAPGADVVLSWLEHEAYAVRVIIPQRFALLDGKELTVAARVRESLERYRPAGVEVRVEYADDRWTLGLGFAVEGGAVNPNLVLRGGTVLWPAPADET